MTVAHGSDCSDFPQPKDRVDFSPFFGHYSSTGGGGSYGGSGSYRSPPSNGQSDRSTGGGRYGGYDPRLYESPPQPEPQTQEPAPAPTPDKPRKGKDKSGTPP